MSGEWNPEPPPTSMERARRAVRYLIVIPVVIVAVLGVIGGVDGLTDRDCEPGLFSACGAGDRALAWAAFIGIPVLAGYYAVVAATYVYRLVTRR